MLIIITLWLLLRFERLILHGTSSDESLVVLRLFVSAHLLIRNGIMNFVELFLKVFSYTFSVFRYLRECLIGRNPLSKLSVPSCFGLSLFVSVKFPNSHDI